MVKFQTEKKIVLPVHYMKFLRSRGEQIDKRSLLKFLPESLRYIFLVQYKHNNST